MAASATYKDTMEKLNSLQLGPRNRRTALKLNGAGLHVMRQWVQKIGYKPSDFNRLNVVHVAGTKGKGTTCAFVNSILSASTRQKIGLYTSPHLIAVRDRIQINSRRISEEVFVKYFNEVWDALKDFEGPKPTYFRFLTLLSFHVFMSEEVDIAIYEVGVGGAWDSTNIIERPCAVGISHLGIDHTRALGNSIEEIAWHKAGIMKSGCPCFTVPQDPKAMGVLADEALKKGVGLEVVNVSDALKDVDIRPNEDFQRANASLAVELARAVLGVGLARESRLPPKFIAGLERMVNRGRTEVLHNGNKSWYLDGAHTQESIIIACRWYATASKIKQKHGSSQDATPPTLPPRILIFNQQSQREAIPLLETLYNTAYGAYGLRFQHIVFCPSITYSGSRYKPDLENRNNDKEDVSKLTIQKGFANFWGKVDQSAAVHILGSIQEAVEFVETCAQANGNTEIFVTGSIHLVGGIISIVEEGILP